MTKPLQKTSKWQRIQKNIGTWHGAFTQFSPDGEIVKKAPSVLSLEETEPGTTMELVLTRMPEDGPEKVNRLTFTAPGPGPVHFFEDGSFEQGAPQWSSFGQFGTEISLKVGNGAASSQELRRVRYVIMYAGTPSYKSALKYVTLICETQEGGAPFETGSFSPAQLLGQWTGTAETFCTITRTETTGNSHWQLDKKSILSCKEHLKERTGDKNEHLLELSSESTDLKVAKPVLFTNKTENALTYQLMPLNQGAYCLLPHTIKREQAFRIEVGWLGNNKERLRLIRYYDTRGGWMRSALIKDQWTNTY